MSEKLNSKVEQLQKVAGWKLLAVLGVSYVISGDFAGWNLGISIAGWGGMLIASLLMCVMYLTLVLSQAEMSSAIPVSGGGYSFARRAMGPVGGFITGWGILMEYAFAPAAIVIFIGNYISALLGVNGPLIYGIFYLVFIGIHLIGVGEALKSLLIITAIAVVAIIATVVALLPMFNMANLFDIQTDPAIVGSTEFLPLGWIGIWAALPFGMWLFLGVEGVPLAAEECRDPAKDMPRGIIASMLFLIVTAVLILLVVPGAVGAKAAGSFEAPLVDALKSVLGVDSVLAKFVNIAALAGLIASFFSLIYGCSRLIFALSRAGYLPMFMSTLNSKKVPMWALIVPGVLGFLASLTGQGDAMIMIAVFGATISYASQALCHILLRKREPNLKRPYLTPGGTVTSGIAFVLSMIALASCFVYDKNAALWALAFFALGIAYFFIFKYKLVSTHSADEELSLIEKSESELS